MYAFGLIVGQFLARDSIQSMLYAITRRPVCPSHGRISQKRLQPICWYCCVFLYAKISPNRQSYYYSRGYW